MADHDSRLLVRLNRRSTVVSPDRQRVVSYDREGRWSTYFRSGITFKRSLASLVHSRWRVDGERRRGLLSSTASAGLFEEVARLGAEIERASDGELKSRLHNEILRWSPERLLSEAQRFEDAYRPISILPPDQYRAVVLQATEGCSWNRCTFCNFYMGRPFQVSSPDSFQRHIDAVKRLLGRGVELKSGVFLADGNALAMSNRKLLPLLDLVEKAFPDPSLFGFVDLFSGERRSLGDWDELARRGLRRVYVGMETGLDELLAFVNKPGSAVEMVRFVQLLKDAGLAVCLIVMVGLGGSRFRDRHAEASLAAIEEMPLGPGDLVYLSPFVEHPASDYRRRRRAARIIEMSKREIEVELARMVQGIRALGIAASRYDIQEFLY